MKLRLLLAALVVCLSGSLVVVPPAGATEPALTVTWPVATRVNPDLAPYAVEVDHSGDRASLLIHNPSAGIVEVVGVPGPEPLVVDFPVSGEWTITVSACLEWCVSDQRVVEVYTDLHVDLSERRAEFGPGREADVRVRVPGPTDESADLEWTVSPDGQPDVVTASGSATVPTGTESFSRIQGLRLPTGSLDGDYRLDVALVSESDDFGRLEGTASAPLVWDTQAPEPVGFTLTGTEIWPERDGYRDSVKLKLARRPGPNDLVVRVVDGNGQVADEYPVGSQGRLTSTFDGRSEGRPLPAGTYEVQVVTIDAAGNEAIASRQVLLHAERLVWQEIGRTFKASEVLVEKYVGRCGQLVKSPKGRPKGSLGYYSDAKCSNSRKGTVATVLGVTLPAAFEGRYRSFRVSVVGGAARSARESRARLAYYQIRNKRYGNRTTLTSKQGRHRGRQLRSGADVVLDPTTAPRVYWSIGVGGGSRYDVTSFVVEMERRVFVLPTSTRSRSRTASEANTIAEPSGAPGPG